MSTTKIIKGCAIDNGQSVFFAQSDKRPTAPWQASTLYIGTGKMWTEEEVRAELSRKDAEIEALRNQWISVEELDKELAPVFQALDWGETRNAISLLAEARTRLTAAATNNTNDNG